MRRLLGAMLATMTVLAGGAAELASAATAPNGLVAYQCTNQQQLPDICVLDPANGAVTNLTNDDAFDGWPSWSPDGTQLAFQSDYGIYVMQADGSGRRHLTGSYSEFSFEPAWSPDGSRIAFVSTRGETDYEIWTVPAGGGGEPVRLTTTPRDRWGKGQDDYQPSWSPDSERLVFVSRNRDETDACDIYAMDSADRDGDGNGDGLLRLSRDNFTNCSPWEDVNPAWSPTGNLIAFSSTHTGNADVWVMNADGTDQRNLTVHPGWDWMPGWSPDGKLITFTSGRDGDEEIYALSPEDAPAPAQGVSTASASDGPTMTRTAAAGEPTPVIQLTHNETDDRLSDWGAAARDAEPRATISRPAHGGVYTRKSLRTLRGTATDDRGVTAVRLALRQRLKDGTCRWWTGSRFLARSCASPSWVAAKGTSEWSYTLPSQLPKTRGRIVSYTLYAKAKDSAGVIERPLETGRNASTFRVEPVPSRRR